nr:hypothetical protein [Tanacetum cinerariifolium]
SGPTWLFDIDTLTKTMNYQPVTTGNPSNLGAGVQEQFDAEKAREKNVQQYVLFPIWSFGSTNPHNTNGDAALDEKEPEYKGRKLESEVNEPEYKGRKLESEVNVSLSSSAQSKKHDDTSKREPKGKSFQDKFNAEKAGEEGDQQYVLFPVWSSGSTNPQNNEEDAAFDGKEHDFDAKKPESEVNVSSSSSAQSRKQDNKTKKEAKGKSPIESVTGYKDINAEFEDCSKNSSNEVNAAVAIVPIVGQNSLNSTNTFSVAGPSNDAVSLTYGKSSFIDASQFTDDPDMPKLEDITYSDDENVVGAEADFNNLETSITVSPIPTTRIHKDHPVSQIIGDLSEGNMSPRKSSFRRRGVQEQFDAEKAREKNVQQYVLFPIWSFGSTNPHNTNGDAALDEKEPEYKGRKLESEVNVSLSKDPYSMITKRGSIDLQLIMSGGMFKEVLKSRESIKDCFIHEDSFVISNKGRLLGLLI